MNGELDRLRAALSDRYTIERELGAGGMAMGGGCVSGANEHTLEWRERRLYERT